ncbi:MAG: ABC-type transport auxiliary lipoprotein family protein [Zoogloeaceae bacterium]|nr:ABC-type transport auxiliary lipoprotein family protein [Zoogloeaceae bacterium]
MNRPRVFPAILFLCLGLLAGCALFQSHPETQARRYDLGPAADIPPFARPWRVSVRADEGLEDTGMRYRLLYADPAEIRVYAHSRWADMPAGVLRQALESRLHEPVETVETHCSLHLELLRFEQEFRNPGDSRGALVVRAALRHGGTLVDERLMTHTAVAPTPDAAGGVLALARAVDQLAAALRAWRAGQAVCRGTYP